MASLAESQAGQRAESKRARPPASNWTPLQRLLLRAGHVELIYKLRWIYLTIMLDAGALWMQWHMMSVWRKLYAPNNPDATLSDCFPGGEPPGPGPGSFTGVIVPIAIERIDPNMTKEQLQRLLWLLELSLLITIAALGVIGYQVNPEFHAFVLDLLTHLMDCGIPGCI